MPELRVCKGKDAVGTMFCHLGARKQDAEGVYHIFMRLPTASLEGAYKTAKERIRDRMNMDRLGYYWNFVTTGLSEDNIWNGWGVGLFLDPEFNDLGEVAP